MSTYQNQNIEVLRQRSPEYMTKQRLGTVVFAVENLRPHAAVEAQTLTTVTSLADYRQQKAAEDFDRQVVANLQPKNEQVIVSPETQATVIDLELHRKQEAVNAAYEGYGNPLLEQFMNNAEESLGNAKEAA